MERQAQIFVKNVFWIDIEISRVKKLNKKAQCLQEHNSDVHEVVVKGLYQQIQVHLFIFSKCDLVQFLVHLLSFVFLDEFVISYNCVHVVEIETNLNPIQ